MKWLPFNQGNSKTQIGVLILLVLFFTALATKCKGAESYAQVGVGTAVVRGQAPVLDLAFVFPHATARDADVEVGATFIGSSDFYGRFEQSNFALRATVIDGLRNFEVGLGAAFLQNTDNYNGSHLNFNLLMGYRFERVPLTIRWAHFSNGGTVMPNIGRDMVLCYWRFQ